MQGDFEPGISTTLCTYDSSPSFPSATVPRPENTPSPIVISKIKQYAAHHIKIMRYDATISVNTSTTP